MAKTKKSLPEAKNTGKNVGSKNEVKMAKVEPKNKLTVEKLKELRSEIFKRESLAAEELINNSMFLHGDMQELDFEMKTSNIAHMLEFTLEALLMNLRQEYGVSISFEMLTTKMYKLIDGFKRWKKPNLKLKDYNLFYDDKFLLNPHVLIKIYYPSASEIAIKLREFLNALFNNQELIPEYIASLFDNYPENKELRDCVLDFSETISTSSFREDIVSQKFLYSYFFTKVYPKADSFTVFALPHDVPKDELESTHHPNSSAYRYEFKRGLILKKYHIAYDFSYKRTHSLKVTMDYLRK